MLYREIIAVCSKIHTGHINTLCGQNVVFVNFKLVVHSAFFLGERKGTRTPKHFVNLTGESKNFKMLQFPLNKLQTCYGYLCDLLSFM
jgi:hypothetical protein